MTDVLSQRLRTWPLLWLTGALGGALSLYGGGSLYQAQQDDLRRRFSDRVQVVTDSLQDRLREHGLLLRATATYLGESPVTSVDQWRAYGTRMNAAAFGNGMHAYGYAPLVRATEVAAFTLSMGKDWQDHTLRVFPDPFGDIRYPVRWLSPENPVTRRSVGFDFYADPLRRGALERALATGETVLSPPLALVTDASQGNHGGFLMLQAVLPARSGSRQALSPGVVFAAYRMADLLHTLPLPSADEGFSLAIRDITDAAVMGTPFFLPTPEGSEDRVLTETRQVDLGGRRWLLRYQQAFLPWFQTPGFWLVSGLGGVVTLLLCLILRNQIAKRHQAQALASAMQERLTRAEERFQLVAQGTNDGIWDENLITGEVYLSDRLQRMLGYEPGDLPNRGAAMRERIHPEDVPRADQALKDHLQARVPYVVEYRFRRGNGTWGWFQSRGQAQWNAAGTVVRMVGTMTDISARKEAEQDLQRTRDFLDHLLQSIPHPVFAKDRSHRYIRVNRAMLAFANCREDELLGTVHVDGPGGPLAAPADPVLDFEEEVFASGGPLVREYDAPIRGRGWRTVIASLARADDGRGNPLIIGTLTDITELRQAERTARRAERSARLAERERQAVLDAATGVAIIATDTEGLIRIFNRGAEQLLGYGASELVGKSSPLLVLDLGSLGADAGPGGEPPANFSALVRRYRDRPGEHVLTLLAKGGRRIPASFSLTSVQDDVGSIAGYLLVATDVTERQRHQAAQADRQQTLEHLVAERTADLRHAKEMAEAASQAKSEFLAKMSHELRTPLHAILSFAQMGEERVTESMAEGGRVLRYFSRIHESGARLLNLVDDLLDLAKLEAGKMAYRMGAVNLAILCRDLAEEAGEVLARRQQTLTLPSPRENVSYWVRGDALRLHQVLRNLIDNSAKFSPPGSRIDVSIHADRLLDQAGVPHPAWRLEVADPGIGIPEEELNLVFEKFEQSSLTRSEAGGTGLGLAICREIITAHGGTIRALNRAPDNDNTGSGTIMVVTLPAARALEDETKP